MSTPSFIHLRMHSEYSIVDGIVRLEDAVRAAAADGQQALALTDLSNTFGLVKFYKAARAQRVKPIAGCDVWVTTARRDRPARALLLVRNLQGYLNICELLSRAWLTNQFQGRAEIRMEWLEEGLAEGLLALSGGQEGDIGQALAVGNMALAESAALRWAQIFPNAFYIEVQRAGFPGEEAYIQQVLQIAHTHSLPVVATHPIQFMTADQMVAHEARVCIAQGEILANVKRQKRFTEQQLFQTQEEMCARFADIPAALANSVQIAQRCNLKLELGQPKLPIFETPAGMTLDAHLRAEAQAGLAKRLQLPNTEQGVSAVAAQEGEQGKRATTDQLASQPPVESSLSSHEVYAKRLEFECDTIISMGFEGYFLIVADFINWAKNNQVPVGPGRGSGAGSLVAYALGITDLDPLQYHLLFERFLNPERVSMPDFDIDFCQQGRDRVIQYVRSKYGAQAVSQIATFGTMAAKAAVRDVGRVLDLGYGFTDGIAKLIPFKPGKLVTIEEALKEEPLLVERRDQEEEVQQLLELAQKLEGITRNVGMHAGGVLIAPGKLTDFCPLYTQSDESGIISQYDKDDVEAMGLVKFDFLGLTTLTILDWAQRYIHQLHAEPATWTLAHIPLKDTATFTLLKAANTVAVFQLESRGMQGMLKDAQPDCFEDIIALVALYRPGPMDLIPSFCARKHGREKVVYPDPRVEQVLKETYGIMVYQEQVMQMAQIIGGYSLGGADLLRRAMGKKKVEEMAAHRAIFREGAAHNDLSAEKADEIFDLMEKFAGYGFNKSHAAAYALLAYQTAWLKTHHLAAFMAANLSLAMDDTDKVKVLFEDSVSNGLRILPPDINYSAYRFEPVAEESGEPSKTIRYGLGAIKGSGQAAIEEIVRVRQARPFDSPLDFCMRVDRKTVNRRTMEALIRAGAFDALSENGQAERSKILATLPLMLEAAEQASMNAMQPALFGDDDGDSLSEDIRSVCARVAHTPWSEKRRLQEEKLALGLYVSGHPFEGYKKEIRCFAKTPLANLTEGRQKLMAGVIMSMRTQMTMRGKMLIVVLDDGSGLSEITIFNALYDENRALFKEDELLIVEGSIKQDSFTGGLRVVAEAVMSIEAARARFARFLKLTLQGAVDVAKLQEQLLSHQPDAVGMAAHKVENGAPNKPRTDTQVDAPPNLGIQICYRTDKAEGNFILGSQWRIYPSDDLLITLKNTWGSAAVEVCYEEPQRAF